MCSIKADLRRTPGEGDFGPNLANVSQLWPQIWPIWADIWPTPAKIWPIGYAAPCAIQPQPEKVASKVCGGAGLGECNGGGGGLTPAAVHAEVPIENVPPLLQALRGALAIPSLTGRAPQVSRLPFCFVVEPRTPARRLLALQSRRPGRTPESPQIRK